MQNKLIPVFIVAAIVQMAILAGAVFAAQKTADANVQIQRSQEIQFRAASMERGVLSANMSNSNFLKALGGGDSPSAPPTTSTDEAYTKGMEELAKVEGLCGDDPFYKEQIAKLKKTLEITRKLGEDMRAQMAAGKAEGMSGMLKVIPSVKALYLVVDKMNIRINNMLQHEEDRAQQLVKQRDQSQQMLIVLLFAALVMSLGGAAMIPVLMRRT